jgi:cytidyltransferase-like protein
LFVETIAKVKEMSDPSKKKKVLVSGCYDLIHGGHVVFFETAAKYGDLYVCIGSDANIKMLKGNAPRFTQDERLYMVQSIRFVHQARIGRGVGRLDFEPELAEIRPDYFVVNSDGGGGDEKRDLCKKYGVEYIELPRVPKAGLPPRSSSGIKQALREVGSASAKSATVPPYRICLAGGWMDQPFVSKHAPGSVVVVNIHPDREFNLRSGMATSTRRVWERIFSSGVLADDPTELAKLLFGYENPPGTQYVAGSQDCIGLTHPGVSRLYYDGGYWPSKIETCTDPATCDWLQQSLRLVELHERPPGYDPLTEQHLNPQTVARLGQAGDDCWQAILARDLNAFGKSLTETHDAWRAMLPHTTSPQIDAALNRYNPLAKGRITSGCGGGYIVLATDQHVPESFGVEVRR